MAQIRGVRDTQQILQDIRPQHWDEKVFQLYPDATPFLRLLTKLSRKAVDDPYFNWFEDTLLAEWDEVTNNAGTGTSIAVTEKSYFSPGDTIKVPESGEIMLVTDATGSGAGTITVARGQGTTVATAIDGSVTPVPILILGNASEEFSSRPEIKSKNKVRVYNYTEIVKTAFGVSGTLDKTKLRTGSEFDYQKAKMGIEHGRELEKKFWWGERGSNTAGSYERRYTGGVDSFISSASATSDLTNLTDLDEDAWNAWLRQLFQNGSAKKLVFCSPIILGQLQTFALEKLRIMNKEKTYGVAIFNLISPHGEVMLVNHKEILKEEYRGHAYGLDMDKLQYKFLRGRDTSYFQNVQENDVDGRIDMWLTEAGLLMANSECHGRLTIANPGT